MWHADPTDPADWRKKVCLWMTAQGVPDAGHAIWVELDGDELVVTRDTGEANKKNERLTTEERYRWFVAPPPRP